MYLFWGKKLHISILCSDLTSECGHQPQWQHPNPFILHISSSSPEYPYLAFFRISVIKIYATSTLFIPLHTDHANQPTSVLVQPLPLLLLSRWLLVVSQFPIEILRMLLSFARMEVIGSMQINTKGRSFFMLVGCTVQCSLGASLWGYTHH